MYFFIKICLEIKLYKSFSFHLRDHINGINIIKC